MSDSPVVSDIVAMTAAHITELMLYERDLFGPEAWSAQAYREELADKRDRYYVVGVGAENELLGWAGIRVLGKEAEILTVGVIPAARRSGLGTRLLTTLLDEARRRRVDDVYLEVRAGNDDAKRIYEREGFAVVGIRRGYYDNGRTDALTMALHGLSVGPIA